MRLPTSIPLAWALIIVAALTFSAAQRTLGRTTPPVRVATTGAGAGGSSAAFWIEKAKERHGMDVEVHVYDKHDYVGGRSTTVLPYNDKSYRSEELGASIFASANKNLIRATEEFGLNVTNLANQGNDMGLWDGSQMLITLTGGSGDTAKMLKRYGSYSLTQTDAIVTNVIEKFLVS